MMPRKKNDRFSLIKPPFIPWFFPGSPNYVSNKNLELILWVLTLGCPWTRAYNLTEPNLTLLNFIPHYLTLSYRALHILSYTSYTQRLGRPRSRKPGIVVILVVKCIKYGNYGKIGIELTMPFLGYTLPYQRLCGPTTWQRSAEKWNNPSMICNQHYLAVKRPPCNARRMKRRGLQCKSLAASRR